MERYADFFAARASMKEDLPYPGGENAADVIRRAVPVMDEIAKSGAETVAVVTHGGVIRSLVTHYLHMDGAYVPLLAKHLENCGITEFYYRESDGEMLLNRFNEFSPICGEPELLRGGWGEKKVMEKRELHSVLTDFLNERLIQVTASGQAEKNDFLKAKIRPVLAKGALHFQAEEFIGKQAFHKNLTAEEAVDYLEGLMGTSFRAASAGGAG